MNLGAASLTFALALIILAAPVAVEAQPAGKVWRIGYLTPAQFSRPTLLAALRELGYVEGQTIKLELRGAENDLARLPALAAELVRSEVDIIVAVAPPAILATAKATKTIPIFAVDLESDPIAMGYVKSLARPGGNVTGVFLDLVELSAKQLQLFKEIAPGVSRVAVVGDPTGNAAQFRATERAAQMLGVQIQKLEGRTSAEIDTALEAARQNRAQAVIVLSSPLVFSRIAHITALAREKRLPTVSLFTEFADAGGLLTYGPSVRESFRRCGAYVAKILNGAKPADMPIERPEKFELVINMKTAKALGLTIPPSVLLRADQVIE